MNTIKIIVDKITVNEAKSYIYPIDMGLVDNLQYSHDEAYCIGEVISGTELPDGVTVANQDDILNLVEPDHAAAADVIDQAAGAARARYITIAPGQEMTYLVKYQDTLAYIAAGQPDDATAFPWVNATATQKGIPPQEAAAELKTLGDAWNNVVGPGIEGRRDAAKAALTAITTNAELTLHVNNAVVIFNLI